MDSYHPDMIALEQQLQAQQQARTLAQALTASQRSQADAKRANEAYTSQQQQHGANLLGLA